LARSAPNRPRQVLGARRRLSASRTGILGPAARRAAASEARAAPREAAGEVWWTGPPGLTINRRSLAAAPGSAQVAQLVEHATENRSVGGSIPPLGTIKIKYLAVSSHFNKCSCPHCVRVNLMGTPPCRASPPKGRHRRSHRVPICSVARSERAGRLPLWRAPSPPKPTSAASAECLQRMVGVENLDAAAGPRVNVEERLSASGLRCGGPRCHHAALSEGSARARPRR
jgi:hypothetical protein